MSMERTKRQERIMSLLPSDLLQTTSLNLDTIPYTIVIVSSCTQSMDPYLMLSMSAPEPPQASFRSAYPHIRIWRKQKESQK